MDDRAIARWRMHSLGLSRPRLATPVAVVERLLGVQAENPSQASWAVACRTTGTTEERFRRALDDGEVLRTHVLRSTWHFVRPDDIVWLQELTGSRVRRSVEQVGAEVGVDRATAEAALAVVAGAIAAAGPLTRDELAGPLAAEGLPSAGRPLGIVLMHGELDALLCSGPTRGGEHTYALLADRAPAARRRDRDEARAELVLRYFSGHGPATERDLSYWATMTLTDVRAGLADVADQLQHVDADGRRFWSAEPPPAGDPPVEPRAHLLQTLDEYHNGYSDSRGVLDAAGIVPAGRKPTVGMVLVDGQMVGGMRRRVTDEEVVFELDLHRRLDEGERREVEAAADRYGRFMGRGAVVRA